MPSVRINLAFVRPMSIATTLLLCLAVLVPVQAKTVGIFYSNWFPFPTAWPNTGGCTWAEPALGYYASSDSRIIDQHTDWLLDAGVDFVMFDWSNNCGTADNDRSRNGNLWAIEDNSVAFVDRQIQRKQAGLRWIAYAIFLGTCDDCNNARNGVLQSKMNHIKERFLSDGNRNQVYFRWYGKPLLGIFALRCEDSVANYNDDQFTIRPMTTNLHNSRFDRTNFWSWEEYVDLGYSVANGRPEATTIRPALRGTGSAPGVVPQYPNGLPGWLNDGSVFGQASIGRRNGETFREQFQKAINLNVDLIMVQSFNQWTGCPQTPGENYNPELSNDVEPMKGGFGSQSLDVMRSMIASYKGRGAGGGTTWPVVAIRNGLTARYLDVASASLVPGGIVHQWDWWGGPNQKWRLAPIDNKPNTFALVSVNSGLCLDVPGGTRTVGVQLIQYTCHFRTNQQFLIQLLLQKGKKLIYNLINVETNMCMDVTGSVDQNGAPIVQYVCNRDKRSQRWRFLKT